MGKGPRLKYRAFIDVLDDDMVYSPATIVRQGEVDGLLDAFAAGDDRREIRRKIRHTLARLSTNRGFPYEGDGWVEIPGQAPLRGWLGWRWKQAIATQDD